MNLLMKDYRQAVADGDDYADAESWLANLNDMSAEGVAWRAQYSAEDVKEAGELFTVAVTLPGEYAQNLWLLNMPRASSRMYFAIPGEQPIHVRDDQALRILRMLSENE